MARILLILTLLAVTPPAWAMQFEADPVGPSATEILAVGPIEAGDVQRLRVLVNRLPPDTTIASLHISSPGGSVAEADALAAAVRAARLVVTVDSGTSCASACFLIFAAAAERRVGASAKIGVHSASIRGEDTVAAMAITTKVARRAGEYGVPPEIVGKLVLTGPRQITWLTQQDLAAMGAHPVR